MYFIYKDKSISQKVWRNKFIYISMYIAAGRVFHGGFRHRSVHFLAEKALHIS